MGSQYATEVSGLTSPLAIRVGFVNSSVARVINETSVAWLWELETTYPHTRACWPCKGLRLRASIDVCRAELPS